MEHLREQWRRLAPRPVVAWGEDHAFTITTNTNMTAQKFVRWLAPDFNSAWVQPDGTVTACYTHAHVGDVETLLGQGWVRMDVMPQASKVFVQSFGPLTEDQIQSVRVCVVQSGATILETSTGLGDAFNLQEHPVSTPSVVTKTLTGFTTSAALSVGGGTYWRMHPVGRPFDVTDARSTDFGPAPQTRTGYSCVVNPWHLFVYTEVMGWFDFRGGRSVVSESDVIAFTGHEMSRRGADGEPLVKPDSLVERYSWGQFVPELLSIPFGEFWAPRSKRLRSWEDFALDRPPGAWIGSSPRALLTKAVLAQFAPGKLAQEQEWTN